MYLPHVARVDFALRYVPLVTVIAILAATPALVFINEPKANRLVALMSALCLIIMSFGCPPEDLRHAVKILRRMRFAAIAPFVWIAIQLLPLPFFQLGHSSWESASAALGTRLSGHITTDIGSTFDVLVSMMTTAVIAFVTVVAAKESRSAGSILTALSVVAALVAIGSMLQASGFGPDSRDSANALTCIASLGALTNLVATMRIVERGDRQSGDGAVASVGVETAGCIAGIFVCMAAVVVTGRGSAIVATFLGLGFILLMFSVRRRSLTVWSASSICAAAVLLLIVAAGTIGITLADLFRLLGIDRDGSNVIRRMLSDSDWFGFGAGAFQRMVMLYRAAGDVEVESPSAAILLILEWGWLGAFVAAISAIQIGAVLLRGAITRRRDSLFPALGAAAILVLFVGAIFGAGLPNLAAINIAAVVVSLGASQSVSPRSVLPH